MGSVMGLRDATVRRASLRVPPPRRCGRAPSDARRRSRPATARAPTTRIAAARDARDARDGSRHRHRRRADVAVEDRRRRRGRGERRAATKRRATERAGGRRRRERRGASIGGGVTREARDGNGRRGEGFERPSAVARGSDALPRAALRADRRGVASPSTSSTIGGLRRERHRRVHCAAGASARGSRSLGPVRVRRPARLARRPASRS